jgi:predicted CoA-binding protein
MSARLRRSSAASVSDFVNQRTLAVVGISRGGKKFGNFAYRELRQKGYRLYPIHPSAAMLEGDPTYPELAALPERVGGVLIMVPPSQAEQVVRDAAKAGIKRVWLQQGAESVAALDACDIAGITAVSGECILMFAEPAAWFHRVHRLGRRITTGLPA